jgi:CheY-like chemotaxis protein
MSKRILLIDDDELEGEYVRRLLQGKSAGTEFFHVRDGVDGLAFLRAEEGFAGALSPSLVLLDLHMPRMDGRTFLQIMRADESLSKIPVTVLLASEELRDPIEREALRVDAYLVKPIEYDDLMKVFQQLNIDSV